MPDNSITIRLTSLANDVDAEAFLQVLRDSLEALRELNREASELGSANLEWKIHAAGLNSPLFATLIAVDPVKKSLGDELGSRVTSAFVAGLMALDLVASPPPLFNETSLKIVSNLTRSYARGVVKIEYETQSLAVIASKSVAQHAGEAARRIELDRVKSTGKYTEYGTVEGHLKGVEAQAAGRDKIVLVDRLTGQELRCYFRSPEIERKVRDNWKRRVAITGEITIDRFSGEPVEMQVDDLVGLRGRDELPQLEDLQGINITDGIESSEYVRGLRNDD